MAQPNKRESSAPLILFAAALLAGYFQMLAPVPFGRGFEMCAIARSLAAHTGFANPFQTLPTGPTAANPPLYPLFLAAVMMLFRSSAAIVRVVSFVTMVANAVTAALLPQWSRRLFGASTPGIVAAVLWIASVLLMPEWDVSLTAVLLLWVCVLCTSPVPVRGPLRAWVLIGILAGLLLLLNPAALLILLPLVFFVAPPGSRIPGRAVVILAIAFLVILPWMARNKVRLGHFVMRTGFGTALYVSNNDCARSSFYANMAAGCYQPRHPNTSVADARLLEQMGEVRYDQMRKADAERWIKSNPRRFLQLTAARVAEFWFPVPGPQLWPMFAMWLGTALSIPGLILMILRRERLVPFLLAAFAIYPLMYYVVVADVRYRYPILWLTFLPAGYLLHRVRCGVLGRCHTKRAASVVVPTAE